VVASGGAPGPGRREAEVTLREALQRVIRPSTTRSPAALWAKSLLNALLFFGVFMVVLPWLAHRLLPLEIPLGPIPRTWLAGALGLAGLGAWIACLDTFSRHGRGTPFPADAPSRLVTTGLFRYTRNPIMAAELAIIWGEALYLASLGPVLYALLISLLAHVLVVHVEEPELARRFGRDYAAYRRRVPRWLPRPWRTCRDGARSGGRRV
jgi:protein-S-isoprenylcysteine O-methyltransferase Ste14